MTVRTRASLATDLSTGGSANNRIETRFVKDLLDSIGTVSGDTTYNSSALDSFSAFWSAIDAGVSPTILMLSDSTQDGTTDPFYRMLVEKIGPARPSACIRYQLWDDTAQKFLGWSTLQNGSAGQRYTLFPAGNNKVQINAVELITRSSADFELEIKMAMDDWTPSAQARVIGQLGGGGNQGWYLIINTSGTIQLSWSADGTALNTSTASSVPPFVDGTAYTIRTRLTASTGAITIEYSTDDGANFINILTQTFGATTIFATTANLQLGAVSGAGGWAGKAYDVRLRDGLSGPIRNPVSIEAFYADDTSVTPLGGSVTIYAPNASMSGQGTAYWSNATRLPKAMQPANAHLAIVALSHNDVIYRTPTMIQTFVGGLLTSMRTQLPTVSIVGTNFNPRNLVQAAGRLNSDTLRLLAMSLYGVFQRAAAGFIDTYRPFLRSGIDLATLVPDGVHSSAPTGVDIWINEVWNNMSARLI